MSLLGDVSPPSEVGDPETTGGTINPLQTRNDLRNWSVDEEWLLSWTCLLHSLTAD